MFTLIHHGHSDLAGATLITAMVTDGATLITDGDIQDGATLVGGIQDGVTQAGDIHTMETTLIAMEEEVLQAIMETETMLTTEIIALAEHIQTTETTLPTEEIIQQIEIIPQTDQTGILILEALIRTEEQAHLRLLTEDLTTTTQTTTTIAITATEDLIIIAETPIQTEVTRLATIATHQEAIPLAAHLVL